MPEHVRSEINLTINRSGTGFWRFARGRTFPLALVIPWACVIASTANLLAQERFFYFSPPFGTISPNSIGREQTSPRPKPHG
jgi:hypothetical protein